MPEDVRSTAWDHLFLPRSHSWFLRILHGLPAQPKIGDREPVIHAMHDIVDAGGMLEYGRGALQSNIRNSPAGI